MKEYYSIIKIDESLDEQIEIPKKVLESEVYKVAIDILHEGEYWLHTHRKKTLDDSMELIEQYANQKVIEDFDLPYHLATATTYILRAYHKHDTPVDCLKKAIAHLEFELEKIDDQKS